ncbi:Uncharacterized membrane protein YckC, RDD family [Cognatiyoonia koreensis]|uniref:Uncharacterized membrane protein YckC, RDD family n=1 Tax=Cognatiyoonia koreensis TaxID=364200 RepID=A0A1I0MJQ2_9RHOB|nr:RDD family protein [Cognatiyoonia koreensis]SEV88535.1 Uncharacterized membrane protein YckC, RDD family [Cognatiyoonia koreensis]
MSRKPTRRNQAQKTASDYNQIYQKQQEKQTLLITPPEGVPIGFGRADFGARVGAQMLDLLITYGILFVTILIVFLNANMSWETAMAFFALLSFLLRIPYYILTELVWNGRTLGKKWVNLRVISLNGRRLEPHQVVVRNLMKEAEVFTPIGLVFGIGTESGWTQFFMFLFLLVTISIPIFSKDKQRIGDMIAGTVVVRQPKVLLATELTEAAPTGDDEFVFEPSHLEHYGKFELQFLEDILRDRSTNQMAIDRDKDVTRTIARKIGFTAPIQSNRARLFLRAFYNAQRAHLEGRQLFGDRREDKYHNKAGDRAQ